METTQLLVCHLAIILKIKYDDDRDSDCDVQHLSDKVAELTNLVNKLVE